MMVVVYSQYGGDTRPSCEMNQTSPRKNGGFAESFVNVPKKAIVPFNVLSAKFDIGFND